MRAVLSSSIVSSQCAKQLTWFERVNRWLGGDRAPSLLPHGLRVYAIGDIHGRLDLLDALIARIEDDARSGPGCQILAFVGDYIDRGPDSKRVVERLLNLPERFHAQFIRGNHDQALLDFIADPQTYSSWKEFGAQETLWSYSVRPPKFDQRKYTLEAHSGLIKNLPAAHLDFFQKLQPYAVIGEYFFTHAGVRPGIALNLQSHEDLMWIRDDFLASTANFGKIVVHGHSPSPHPIRRTNRIGIDTGAYATGKLTAAVLEGSELRFLQT